MSVSAIGSMSGTSSVTDAYTELQKAQQKLASDLAAKADAAKVLAEDRDAVSRAQQATQAAQAAQAAQQAEAAQAAKRAAERQVLPVAQTPQQQSKPVTASATTLGASFDVTV
jgi:septal ring factor EnvC (AmiA/AmiB activator)